MENLALTKWEKRLLHTLEKYDFADIGDRELHGYFKFPPIETTFSAIGGLKSKGFIRNRQSPCHGYELTDSGRQYLLQHKLSLFIARNLIQIGVTVIAGLVLAYVSRLLWP